jgi:hypothetical protein
MLMLALIEAKKFPLVFYILCLSLFFLYLRDYILSFTFIFGDALYTSSLLLFLYFLLNRAYLWCGISLFFVSIVRFPGYFLGASFLLFYLVFFKQNMLKNRKLIISVFVLPFLGMFLCNIIYPVFLHGFSIWMHALYFENIGVEHFSRNYLLSFRHFYSFISGIVRYTFFTVFFIMWKKDKTAFFLIVSIIPYMLIVASVEHSQIYYMFPIVSVALISGVRCIQKLFNPKFALEQDNDS